MKLVMTYRASHGEDDYYTFEKNVPIEYESAEKLSEDFKKIITKCLDNNNLLSQDFKLESSNGKEYNFIYGYFISFNSTKGTLVYEPPVIKTLEEWFNSGPK